MFEKLVQLFERLVMALMILAILPCLLGAIMRAIGTLNLLLVLAILCVVGYLRHAPRTPIAGDKRRNISDALRRPITPKEDE